MARPHYEQFRFESDISAEAVLKTASERQVAYVPTGSFHDDEEQHLAVYKTTPQNVTRQKAVVRLAPWSDDFGRPENYLFDSYVAETLGTVVYSPNMPGIDYPGWGNAEYAPTQKATREQLDELHRSGSFRKIGAAVWRALTAAERQLGSSGNEERSPSFVFAASSMAVASLAGVVRAAADNGRGDSIKGAVIGEGVNYISRHPAKLMWQFVSQKHPDQYLAQNPELLQNADEGIRFWLGRVAVGREANIAYFKALSKGSFRDDIGDLDDYSHAALDVPFFVHSGSQSHLSPVWANMNLAAELEGHNVDTQQEVYLGHDHPYTMAVRSVTQPLSQVL